jgi:hypothetical protein
VQESLTRDLAAARAEHHQTRVRVEEAENEARRFRMLSVSMWAMLA